MITSSYLGALLIKYFFGLFILSVSVSNKSLIIFAKAQMHITTIVMIYVNWLLMPFIR